MRDSKTINTKIVKIVKIFVIVLLCSLNAVGEEPETSFECSYNEKEDVLTYKEYYIVDGKKTYHGLTMIIRNSKGRIGSTVRVTKEIYKNGRVISSSDASSIAFSAERSKELEKTESSESKKGD